MNQSILFNDDLMLVNNKWKQTGILSGQLITVTIISRQKELDATFKLDIEMAIEDWLEDNEPDENNHILITLD